MKSFTLYLSSLLLLVCITINSCKPDLKDQPVDTIETTTDTSYSTINDSTYSPSVIISISETELNLQHAGLLNIRDLDTNIQVDLRYSTENNFMKTDVYGDLNNAYLQADVTDKLVKAQLFLKEKMPDYNLILFDAARPMSIQQKMWDILDMPTSEKTKYISNPKNGGSLHNYGAAVDLSIVDENGDELDMGTPYDHFDELAYPIKEQEMLASGRLSETQINNRKLLRAVMWKAGFFNIQTEWWHFNSCTRVVAQSKYKLIE